MSNINMSNININNGDGNNDEGYKRFLAFLASSPNPNPNTEENAGAVEGSCPHTSESESEEREQSDQATMSTSTSTSTSKSWEETTGGSVAALISEQLGVDIGTWVDDDDGEEKSLDQLLSRPKPKLEGKKEEDHLKSELKEEPAETKGNERRRSSRRLSLNLSLRRSQSNKTARSNSILNNLGEIAAVERPPRAGQHPDYPFENVVFQGGGAKGGVYVGVFQAFEKLGILPYLKRFAGASAGSFPALALALGLSAEQAKAEMDSIDMQGFMDGGSSTISHLRNIKKRLGMHPGDKLLEHFGGVLGTGDSDLTFLGL